MGGNSHFRVRQAQEKRVETIRAETADSFVNLTARLGFGAGSQQDASKYRLDFISRNPFNLEAAYRSNWLCGKVIDCFAEDMTRAGTEILSDDLAPDDIEILHKSWDRLRIWAGVTNAIKWGRLYGGGILVMLVDGQNLNTPLNVKSIAKDQFKGVVALDRWQIDPSLSTLVTDYGPDLGQPKYYNVNNSAQALVGEKIHYSRCIRIDGLELPWRQKLAENGWGQSVLERLWDRVVAFDSTSEGAAQLVYKAHLRTVKIKGLRELIAGGGKALEGLIAQMQFVKMYQSNEGLTVLDGTDEFETHAYTFAGLDNLLEKFGEQLSGATGIPLVRLFGQSPAGMNSSGDSDMRTYYDNIAQQQEDKLRTGVTRLYELSSMSELGKPIPEGFDFNFVTLWQLTEEQKAIVAKAKTEAIVSAEGAGIITKTTALKELRQSSRITGVFTNISDEDIEEAEQEPPKPTDLAVDPLTGLPVPIPPAIPGAPVEAAPPTPGTEGTENKTPPAGTKTPKLEAVK